MKKLYIPTSSLNFNNILSSESVSPKAFYTRRNFGYSRWTSIPENGMENVILLYEHPFRFTRPQSDVEDHPMLIEIVTEENYPALTDDLYYSDHTIYLSPWRTRFIFFSEQDKQIALSLSDNALEVKLLGLYKNRIAIGNYGGKAADWNKDADIKLNECAIKHDYRINKMKGLLYGYYIGALLSESPLITQKYNILQELENIFSAILASENIEITSYQNRQLNDLLTKLQQANPAVSFLKSQLSNPVNIDSVISDLTNKYGVIFPNTIDKNLIIDALCSSDRKRTIHWLKDEKAKLEQEMIKERMPLFPSESEIILTDNYLAKISEKVLPDAKENKLMEVWVNETLSSGMYNGKISLFKKELSDAITVKAKEIYSESWENSENKQKLNQMRRYIQGQESTFSWDSYLISSIASVLAKGDDWDKLLTFMRNKNMSDYRLAFAFYGELNGFANLTRDFTDNLFDLNDRKYVADVYAELYGQVLGVSPKFLNNKETIDEKFMSFREKVLKAWLKIKKGLPKQKQLEEALEVAFKQNGSNQDVGSFMDLLDSNIWKRSCAPWKKMCDELHIGSTSSDLKLREISKKIDCQKSKQNEIQFFQDDEPVKFRGYFYNDKEAWDLIKDLVPDSDQKRLKKDLDWFQALMQKPKLAREYYSKVDENNDTETIERFCHLKEGNNQKGKLKAPYFTEELREKIKERLMSHYVSR